MLFNKNQLINNPKILQLMVDKILDTFSLILKINNMNRILVTALACLVANISLAQNPTSKIFKSEVGHFSFAYPSYLESKKINNSPHMILSLDSKKYSLTLALWEYGFERFTTIWDKDIITNFLDADKSVPNSQIEKSCEKMYLTIANNTKVKCLKNVSTTRNSYHGRTINIKQIAYRFLHNGIYLQFYFFVFDNNDYWNNLQFSDEIMKGLKLL